MIVVFDSINVDLVTASSASLHQKPDAVMVQIVESPKDSKAKGGVPFTER